MSENPTASQQKGKNELLIAIEIIVGIIVTLGTSVSIATWNQIQNSDRAIVRLETKIAGLEQAIADSRSTNQEVMVLRSQVDELSRRLEKLETGQ